MSENELREAFRELTSQVRPGGPAYPQLMKRKQREHRARTAGWATAAVSTGLALLLVPLSFTAGDGGFAVPDPSASPGIESILPSPPYSPPSPGPMTPYIRSVIEAPTRGDLATDQAFLNEASDRARMQNQTLGFAEPAEVKVLFAGDVGEFRVVIVSLYTSNMQSVVFMAGHRGAGLKDMGGPGSGPQASVSGTSRLKPFFRLAFRRLIDGELTFASVALAPPGCTVATAGADLLWKDVSTGSYLASAQSAAGLDARVTCEGKVRFEGALGDSVIPLQSPISEAGYVTAKQGMIGETADEVARSLVSGCDAEGAPRIRYGGPLFGLPGQLYLATCFDVDGSVEVHSAYHRGKSDSAGFLHFMPRDAPGHEVIGADLVDWVVIIAPLATTEVQVTDRSGTVRKKIAIYGGVGITSLGTTGWLRALDASGRETGLGAIAGTVPPTPAFPYPPTAQPRVDDWS